MSREGELCKHFQLVNGESEEVQLSSAHWWRPADWGRILSHQECCRHTAVRSWTLKCTRKRRSSSCLRRIESPVAFTVLDMTPKRASLDLDFGPKVEAVPGAVCRRRNRPSSYGLTSPSPTPGRFCMSACGRPTAIGHEPTPLLRHLTGARHKWGSESQGWQTDRRIPVNAGLSHPCGAGQQHSCFQHDCISFGLFSKH